jgi:hypothetical protein
MRMVPLLLFVLSSLILVALIVLPSPFEFTSAGSFGVSGIGYSASPPAKVYEQKTGDPGEVRAVHISMSFKTASVGQYANAFQTAPENRGIRLELAAPNTAALIVGANNVLGYTAYILTTKLQFNQWYTLTLDIDRNDHIVATLDGNVVVDETNPTLSYLLSDTAIGSGFTLTRRFTGDIKDASIEYSFYKHNPNGAVLLMLARLVSFAASLAFLYLALGYRPSTAGRPAA